VVALFSILTVAVDVQNVLYNELIEEINLAAGLALVDQYIADYTVEELEELVTYGRTIGERLAADRALYEINGGFTALITLGEGEVYADEAALYAAAVAGDQDAAQAWFFLKRREWTTVGRLETAILSGIFSSEGAVLSPANRTTYEGQAIPDSILYWMGYALGGFYGPGSPVGMKTVAELMEIVKTDESYPIRVAAAVALSTNWIIDQPLDIAQTQAKILGVTLVYPELAFAYQLYLTYLFGL
jgi:hypothetical protein